MGKVALTFYSGMGTFCYFPENPVLSELASSVTRGPRAAGRLGTHLWHTNALRFDPAQLDSPGTAERFQ